MLFPTPMRSWMLLLCAGLSLSSADRDAQTMGVPAGASLQQAIDRARPGDTLLLTPGAIYTGNFVLPVKPGIGTSRSALPEKATASRGSDSACYRSTPRGWPN